jgi:hypothetical protein
VLSLLPQRPGLPGFGRLTKARTVNAITKYALQFPSNVSGSDTAAPYVAIEYANPQSNGLPIWGASNAGVTVIRKLMPHQQTGYYAQFWWSQGNGSIDLSGGYWGMHPYPSNGSNSGTTHVWEIATAGGDFFNSAGSTTPGDGETVTQDATRLQAMTVTRAGASSKTLRFYRNLPNVTSADYIQRVETTSNYGETDPPSPKVIIGDSPWFASYQHERASCTLDAIKIFSTALSEADMLLESASFSTLVTPAGQAAIWWGKNGFRSLDDLVCDFGTGRSFVWANANKGTLVSRL